MATLVPSYVLINAAVFDNEFEVRIHRGSRWHIEEPPLCRSTSILLNYAKRDIQQWHLARRTRLLSNIGEFNRSISIRYNI